MVFWTIQHEKAVENMYTTGTLRADSDHLLFDGDFGCLSLDDRVNGEKNWC
jgi:hypothetical protein